MELLYSQTSQKQTSWKLLLLSGQLDLKCTSNHGRLLYTQEYHVRINIRYIQFKSIQISPKNKTFLDYKRYLHPPHMHQKSTLFLPAFLRYYKDFANLFWVLWGLLTWLDLIASTCGSVSCLSACNYPSPLSWDIEKILQILYFGCFKHAWLWPPKAISVCRKIWCLTSRKKSNNLSLTSFLRYCYDIATLIFLVL